MGDHIQVDTGRPPWRPAQDAELVQTFRFWNIPLAGLLRQHGSYFVFACLDGEVEDESTWGYIAITPTERLAISDSAEPYKDAMERFAGLTDNEYVVIAHARPDEGVFKTDVSSGPIRLASLA